MLSFFAFFAFFFLPNMPRTTSWLTEEERQMAVWRLDEDIGEDDWTGSQQQTFGHGLKLAASDVKMWILVGITDHYLDHLTQQLVDAYVHMHCLER